MSYKKLTTIPPGEIKELSTDAEMNAVLNSENVGKCYKFTGTTGTYVNGHLYEVEFDDPTTHPLTFTANTAGSTISMYQEGTPTLSQNFSYSTDGFTWSTFTPTTDETTGTTVTLTNVGDKVYFKGNNPNGVNEGWDSEYTYLTYYAFNMTGSIAASGNIMSLIDNGACNTLIIPNQSCFYGLFDTCNALTSAPILPATELKSECYNYLFNCCTSLTEPPELPAMSLAPWCYANLFLGCTSLTIAPVLPATILDNYCYGGMFWGCSSLTTPPLLPTMNLSIGSYVNMFYNCTSLTTAPELPATTLASSCYSSMFAGCTALTDVPELPAITAQLYCYKEMFKNCTSLTTVPVLPATTLGYYCYSEMFSGCTSLQVNDSPVSGIAEQAWTIPTSGTFTNTYLQYAMFTNCLGTRSSDNMAGATGSSYTYYTQNTPV